MKLPRIRLRTPDRTLRLPEALWSTIETVARRKGVTPCELVELLVNEAERERQAAESLPGRWKRLTRREQQIVFLVCQGLSNREISERLSLSKETVKVHLRSVMSKLNLQSRYQVATVIEALGFREGGRRTEDAGRTTMEDGRWTTDE